jgi:hypothetical protein
MEKDAKGLSPEELEKRMAELARRYAETHDEQVTAEIGAQSLSLADRFNPHRQHDRSYDRDILGYLQLRKEELKLDRAGLTACRCNSGVKAASPAGSTLYQQSRPEKRRF